MRISDWSSDVCSSDLSCYLHLNEETFKVKIEMFSDVVNGEAEITFQIINDLALLRCFMRGKISVQFAECLIREGQVGAFVDFAQNSVRVLDPFMEIEIGRAHVLNSSH